MKALLLISLLTEARQKGPFKLEVCLLNLFSILLIILMKIAWRLGILLGLGLFLLIQNRNATCGQHKEEILGQLRKLAKVEQNMDSENLGNLKAVVPKGNQHPGGAHLGFRCDAEPTSYLAYEVMVLNFFSVCS